MPESMQMLTALAEVAIALAGFSAIVVVLKRGTGGAWNPEDRDQFVGMVIHAAFAVAFCFLPALINVVVQDPVTTLHVACALIGLQIAGHSLAVMRFATTGLAARLAMVLGLLVAVLQFTAFTDWGVHRELEFYVVGIIWHILQSGLLFVLLVWIPIADAAPDETPGGD